MPTYSKDFPSKTSKRLSVNPNPLFSVKSIAPNLMRSIIAVKDPNLFCPANIAFHTEPS